MPVADELAVVALRIGAAVAEAVIKAVATGDESTLKALKLILKDAEQLKLIDAALMEQQRQKAHSKLGTRR
jgi:hypothetical protein